MCKAILSDEEGMYKTILVSKETPSQILAHYKINPDTKIVYLNGKILSREKMNKPIPEIGTVHIAIKNRTIRQ